MLRALTGRAAVLVAVLAVLCVQGCGSSQSKKEAGPAPGPSAPYWGNRGYALPDSPFTREGTVVTATCSMGARYAGVNVQAWDPERWQLRETRNFFIPTDAAFTNYKDAKNVNSPLVDLCGVSSDSPSPYAVDDLEYVTPRVRALFDLAYTRMAVVLRDADGGTTHAGYVQSGGNADDFVSLSDARGDDEQNAVMAPDGRSVWFTYITADGERRIGSRPAQGDHRLSDEGPAIGHDLPLIVTGKPPRAVQANMAHLAPDGRRLTATAPKIYGHVFHTLDSSGPLTAAAGRSATLLSGCVGIVGWVGDERVLCRSQLGNFRTMDARSGRPEGNAVAVVREDDGRVAEGMVVSADGEKFIASVHSPNDRSGQPSGLGDFRVVSTSGEGAAVAVSAESLTNDTVFLEWR
ncbi:hypothetical protein [Streptomyces massasporeus]|uniref:hypothetical protein n=1 Tax=Streptomyces massasporeus TaxID=67324 RepID=UPI0019CA01C5|nr:hypothetical protein [Streptomyces massasporeus]GGV60064.1 hypothetical protein GCM10010228_07640 [Streptomyces massasporeus]